MSLQSKRIQSLCEELKLAGVAGSFSALATQAADTEQSFVDFLENALIIEQLGSLNFLARRENVVFLGLSDVGKTHLWPSRLATRPRTPGSRPSSRRPLI